MAEFTVTIRIGEDGVKDSKELACALIDVASRLDHGASLPGTHDDAEYFDARYGGRRVGRATLNPLGDDAEKYKKALRSISSLWPEPPHCAAINPEYIGPNDGKMRAILIEAAIDIARKALSA